MVELVPMSGTDFRRYLEIGVEDYAQSRFKCGDCGIEEARAHAKDDYGELLPEGLASPNQHLFCIHAGDVEGPIGMVWLALREKYGTKSAYIYDLRIDAAHRGKGYGEGALLKTEEHAASLGAVRIGLNVMGWNHAARRLYEKAGFAVVGIGMTKFFS